jgi:hypothetical protein
METENNNNVCPICGKQMFKSKSRILNFIYYNNCRKGGDGYRAYYSPKCGCYHLTSNIPTPEHNLRKVASKYNRLNQKEKNTEIFRHYGII